MPRSETVSFRYAPVYLPRAVTVVLGHAGGQITDENDVATAWIGGAEPDLPPPVLIGLEPVTVLAGGQVALTGRELQPGIVALLSDAPTGLLVVDRLDAESATLQVDASLPAGVHLISLRNPDGRKSNLLPLTVTD